MRLGMKMFHEQEWREKPRGEDGKVLKDCPHSQSLPGKSPRLWPSSPEHNTWLWEGSQGAVAGLPVAGNESTFSFQSWQVRTPCALFSEVPHLSPLFQCQVPGDWLHSCWARVTDVGLGVGVPRIIHTAAHVSVHLRFCGTCSPLDPLLTLAN